MSAAPFEAGTSSQGAGSGISGVKRSFPVKDRAILFAWIAGIIIIAAVSWILTQPLRNRFLIDAVNQELEQSGDSRRLAELPPAENTGYFGMGAWFAVRASGQSAGNAALAGTKAFVFSFLGEGTFFPCAAVVNGDGSLQEFIPLSRHGKTVLERISPGILKIYTRRIEGLNHEPAF